MSPNKEGLEGIFLIAIEAAEHRDQWVIVTAYFEGRPSSLYPRQQTSMGRSHRSRARVLPGFLGYTDRRPVGLG